MGEMRRPRNRCLLLSLHCFFLFRYLLIGKRTRRSQERVAAAIAVTSSSSSAAVAVAVLVECVGVGRERRRRRRVGSERTT
jgi:hypothetical protein